MSTVSTGLRRVAEGAIGLYVLALLLGWVVATIAVFVVDWPWGFALLIPGVFALVIWNAEG